MSRSFIILLLLILVRAGVSIILLLYFYRCVGDIYLMIKSVRKKTASKEEEKDAVFHQVRYLASLGGGGEFYAVIIAFIHFNCNTFLILFLRS